MNRLYRIEVDKWPTDDGQPWAREYGTNMAVPYHEIPAWLVPLLTRSLPHIDGYNDKSDLGRIAARVRYDTDRDELIGVLMPKPKRRNYVSAAGVQELARDMRAFGAVVRVITSDPITWTESEDAA